MHARAREMREASGNFVPRAQAAILVSEQGGQVTAPGGVHMHREAQPARQRCVARRDQAIDRVDRSVLGGAEHAHRHQHGLALAFAVGDRFLQRIDVQAHVAFRHQLQLRAAEAEQLHALRPRVVRGDRGQHPRRLQLGMRGEEIAQAALLEALCLHPVIPGGALARRVRGQPRRPARDQFGARGRTQVERRPVVVGHAQAGHAGRAQRDRECLQRQRQPHRLVVGDGAARRQVAERAAVDSRVMRVANHARQLQADIHFHVDGDGCGVLADVVRVVGQGQDLRREPGQQ